MEKEFAIYMGSSESGEGYQGLGLVLCYNQSVIIMAVEPRAGLGFHAVQVQTGGI